MSTPTFCEISLFTVRDRARYDEPLFSCLCAVTQSDAHTVSHTHVRTQACTSGHYFTFLLYCMYNFVYSHYIDRVLTNSLMSVMNMDGTGDKLPFRRMELYRVMIGNYILFVHLHHL